jgi:hypothetical protein
MRGEGPRALALLAGLATAFLAGCGADLFGPPARVATHGYRALATIKEAGKAESFEVAVRGDDRRKDLPGGAYLLLKGAEKKAYRVDPAAKTVTAQPFGSLDDLLPGHPLTPGFSEWAEASRRGVKEFSRESDSVFAGHVCWLWRFDDRPNEMPSPSTTYWYAPDLDKVLMRVDRETPNADGTRQLRTTELTNVRVGASPKLFQLPEGFKTQP